jgi:hypothetical protein
MYRRELAVLAVVATLVLWGGAATAVHAPAEQVATDDADSAAVASAAVQAEDAAVTFSDQSANDSTVTVDNATLPEGGYVVVHDNTLLEGEVTGSVVGVSDYLEAGTHENVSVTLYENVSGADFSNATTPNGTETFVAMPHQETNNNTTYDFVATNGTEDGPYTVDGEAVVDDANVTFGADEAAEDRGLIVADLDAPAYAATNTTVAVNATLENTADEERTEDIAFRLEGGGLDVVVHQNVTAGAGNTTNTTFEVNTTGVPEDEYIHGVTTYNSSEFATITVTDDAQVRFTGQATNDTNVTVNSLFVPEGGYVVVHDNTLLEGEVTGSVVGVSDYLEAGYYENVAVTLYEGVPGADFSNATTPNGTETFVAMPHQETNNNTTYDFVATNGTEDGPYTVDGDPVVDDGVVNFIPDQPGEGASDGEAGDGESDGEASDGEADDSEAGDSEEGSGEPTTENDETTTASDEETA